MNENILDYCDGQASSSTSSSVAKAVDTSVIDIREYESMTSKTKMRKRRHPSQISIPISLQSHFRGVCWNKSHKSWHARIEFNGKREHLGYFYTPEDAAKAYDKRAIELFGKNAIVNFKESLNDEVETTEDSTKQAPYYCGKRVQKDDVVRSREIRKRRRAAVTNDTNSNSSKNSMKSSKTSSQTSLETNQKREISSNHSSGSRSSIEVGPYPSAVSAINFLPPQPISFANHNSNKNNGNNTNNQHQFINESISSLRSIYPAPIPIQTSHIMIPQYTIQSFPNVPIQHPIQVPIYLVSSTPTYHPPPIKSLVNHSSIQSNNSSSSV